MSQGLNPPDILSTDIIYLKAAIWIKFISLAVEDWLSLNQFSRAWADEFCWRYDMICFLQRLSIHPIYSQSRKKEFAKMMKNFNKTEQKNFFKGPQKTSFKD